LPDKNRNNHIDIKDIDIKDIDIKDIDIKDDAINMPQHLIIRI